MRMHSPGGAPPLARMRMQSAGAEPCSSACIPGLVGAELRSSGNFLGPSCSI